MTARIRAAAVRQPQPLDSPAPPATGARRMLTILLAGLEAARPRQWPKNLLVFAAPLAGATLGRDDGLAYAVVAAAAFTAASAAVYLINDVADAERDRRHPAKRRRPVASGRLPVRYAIGFAALGIVLALAACVRIDSPMLAAVIGTYVVFSVLYTLMLKHIPVVEVAFVAVGFVLRALGGAAATHVPPSGWFLTVCSLGALMVAIGKRYTELAVLGDGAAGHRPVMRWYSLHALRAGQRLVSSGMLGAYLLWALAETDSWMRAWHLASVVPLGIALLRFDRLTAQAEDKPVEDLISRDPVMLCCEVTWLALFLVGL